MSLPAPDLDSRRFEDLVREARARIPRYTPEWTDLNDSDPGMTLVKLHAWLTETILFQLNRVPELNYVKFLDLLGIVPTPAHPARTELTFTLDPLDRPIDPLVVTVPRLSKVAVDDPDQPSEVVFETDRTLVGLNAAIGALICPHAVDGAQTRQLVSIYDEDTVTWPHTFDPLAGAADSPPAAFYLGLVLRPQRRGEPGDFAEDRFPVGPLDLYADAVRVGDTSPPQPDGTPGTVVTGPSGLLCPAPGTAEAPAEHLEWHVYVGDGSGGTLFEDDLDDTGWARLAVSEDSTRGLSGSGHVVLEMPATTRPLDPLRLSRAFWESFGAVRPPQTKAELEDQLRLGTLDIATGLAPLWTTMGADATQADELEACEEDPVALADKVADPAFALDPSRLTLADWIAVNAEYGESLPATDEAYRPLHWIRGRIKALPSGGGAVAEPVPMRGLHLNTVAATQASTRLDDRLGRSNARPAQAFTLPKTPVLIDPATGQPDLEIQIVEEGQPPQWTRVEDFSASGREDPHYVLDPRSGRITLGDGRHGRIPVAGSQVTAVRYRVGGGNVGNVGAGVVSKVKGRLRGMAGVANLRSAHDGSDAEELAEVKLRAPRSLRTCDRAVSAEDFADLALRTPGVALHTALALPRRAVAPDETLVDRDGAVTLVVLPVSDALMPQPDEDATRAICRWLEPRRLVTTELHVIGPRYAMITRLSGRLTVRRDRDLAEVQAAVYDALLGFLDPFTGGEESTGWSFGQDVYYGDLYERILAVPGVRRAWHLSVEVDGVPGDSDTDVAAVPEGHLPALPRERIDLVVGYD